VNQGKRCCEFNFCEINMPSKIKLLWVACILVIFFGFIYFSVLGQIDVARQKGEARATQKSRLDEKQKEKKQKNKGRTFKVDPIKEIKELNALGKYEEAVKYAEGVATLNPDRARIYTWWGISLVKAGKRSEAIEKFVRADELDQTYAKTYLSWGLTLAMDGKVKEAMEKYQKAVELKPESSNAYAYWGAALGQLNQHAQAVEKLERALEINPKNANVFGVLIDSLFHQKMYGQAWNTVKKAREAKVTIAESSLKRLADVFPEPSG
jgi:tetratricopeptide (TPR) repeat protein